MYGRSESVSLHLPLAQKSIHTNEFLALSLRASDLGTWAWRVQSGELTFDERWAEMVGYSLAHLPPRIESWEGLVHPEDRDQSRILIENHLAGSSTTYRNEHRLRHRDGRWIWVYAFGCVVERTKSGAPVLFIGIHLDITDRKESEFQLCQAKEQLEEALEAAELGTWRRDYRNGRTTRNARWHTMLGYAAGEIEETPEAWLSLLHPDDRSSVVDAVQANLLECPDGYRIEYRLRCQDGTYLWVLDWGRVIERGMDGKPVLVSGVMLDITAEREAKRLLEESRSALLQSELRARHAALHDALTSLPNRVLLFERLSSAVADLEGKAASLAVLCIDLDRFKEINDTLGHAAGDQLLHAIAGRLQVITKPSHILARMGGDEFVLVAIDADNCAAEEIARKIIGSISSVIDLESGSVFVGCSVGITIVTDSAKKGGEALREADIALYAAKKAGRGCYCVFDKSMNEASCLRTALETDLRKALVNQDGSLSVVYQPQRDPAGTISCVEALVRWNHPQHGPISPEMFIPIAEQSGLIAFVGRFVLQQVLHDRCAWDGLKVAINVSTIQLRSSSFLEEIANMLEKAGVVPSMIEIEITESVFLEENGPAQKTLETLKALGCSLVLDDFGTGYSSFNYLINHSIDKIKIDQSFIARIGQSPKAYAVIQAIVSLAQALNIELVAEGIETGEQNRLLLELGVTRFQGYLHGRPVSADEITRQWEATSRVLASRSLRELEAVMD